MQNEQAETPLAMELTREGHLVVKMRGIILGELDRGQALFLALGILNYCITGKIDLAQVARPENEPLAAK